MKACAFAGAGAVTIDTARTMAVAAPAGPVIAAASSLRFCADQLASAFVSAGGAPLRLVFGSSGNLVRQIEQGAPFALFLSADEDFALRLIKARLTLDGGAVYAVGRLALVSRRGRAADKAITIDSELKGLGTALWAGKVTRFAIANPEHAPYGRRAREVLQHARLWGAMKAKLALGENVAQAAQYAGSGAADAGLIANALARAPRYAKLVNQALVPASWHTPLPQRMVRLVSAGGLHRDIADRFYQFMLSAAAREILSNSGFDLPDVK